MRRIALAVIAALVAGAASAGSAEAINSEQKFSASPTPAAPGTAAKPAPVALSVRQWFDDISARPGHVRDQADPHLLPEGDRLQRQPLPAVLAGARRARARRAAAPRGSAAARASARRSGSPRTCELEIYNGPGGNRVEIRVIGTTPLEIDGVIEAKLTSQTADPRYGQVLTVMIPAAFTRKIFDTYATLTDLSAKVPVRTVKVGKRKLPYAGLTGCAAGSLTFGYSADYTDGTTSTVEAVQPCGGGGPDRGRAGDALTTARRTH